MNIIDEIKRRILRAGQVLSWNVNYSAFADWGFCHHKFSELIWYNICDLVTDLIEDVQPVNTGKVNDTDLQFALDRKFTAFKTFMYKDGKQVLQRLYDEGYVVIGYNKELSLFYQMQPKEYTKVSAENVTFIEPHNKDVQTYVMRSSTYVIYNKSDKEICKGFLDFLDDVLNGSATVSRRLGAVVVASPKNLNSAPTAIVLTDDQKKKLEEDMQREYGALSNQSNMMLLPREMAFQVINLAGIDMKMQEKAKTAILAIADRIKIPANQVAIVDAQSNKALANGSEIREGDKLKYKTFRRLFERTFADMARYFNIPMNYVIDGEPIDKIGEAEA